MKAKITRLDNRVKLPKYQTSESAGFDLASNEDKTVPANSLDRIKTGLIIQAPKGHFLLITARSSLAAKKGLMLANGVGTIDRDYSGPLDEIFISVYNFTRQPVEIKKGERLAQGIFIKIDQVKWEEVQTLAGKDRGGHGSTGGYKV